MKAIEGEQSQLDKVLDQLEGQVSGLGLGLGGSSTRLLWCSGSCSIYLAPVGRVLLFSPVVAVFMSSKYVAFFPRDWLCSRVCLGMNLSHAHAVPRLYASVRCCFRYRLGFFLFSGGEVDARPARAVAGRGRCGARAGLPDRAGWWLGDYLKKPLCRFSPRFPGRMLVLSGVFFFVRSCSVGPLSSSPVYHAWKAFFFAQTLFFGNNRIGCT